jgi:hypothetical protein
MRHVPTEQFPVSDTVAEPSQLIHSPCKRRLFGPLCGVRHRHVTDTALPGPGTQMRESGGR